MLIRVPKCRVGRLTLNCPLISSQRACYWPSLQRRAVVSDLNRTSTHNAEFLGVHSKNSDSSDVLKFATTLKFLLTALVCFPPLTAAVARQHFTPTCAFLHQNNIQWSVNRLLNNTIKCFSTLEWKVTGPTTYFLLFINASPTTQWFPYFRCVVLCCVWTSAVNARRHCFRRCETWGRGGWVTQRCVM